MAILQQSSRAQDRNLGTWYTLIHSGQLKLPRFQRMEVWDRSRVTGFLNTIIQNLPVGVTLLLEVGDREKFVSCYIAGAPATGARVTEHLLDGQQRLTAFWRAMHNDYAGETYYVYLPQFDRKDDDGRDSDEICVEFQGRWRHKDTLRPVWADSPQGCLERGLVPIDLLCPGDQAVRVGTWVEQATAHLKPVKGAPDFEEQFEKVSGTRQALRDAIAHLRERVTHFNLPYLALPASTEAKVALNVFVNMNTNSKPLSMFDLTVAMVEEQTGTSLHDLQAKLEEAHPQITRYGDLAAPLLQVGALLQGMVPNQTGISATDKQQLVKDWSRIGRGMVRACQFLERQHIYDGRRLPTNVVLPVLAASFDAIPEDGDALGRGEHLLRAYLWSAVFTGRYEGAAATRAFQDCKALLALLSNGKFGPKDYASVPVMDRTDYPLPNFEQLTRVGWPKGSDRMARAILAATLYFGGWDFADGRPASFDGLKTRQYHHVFPDALLQDAGIESSLALNCALITAKTNRTIGRKDPLDYLKDRVEWAGEDSVRQRLKTHLLDYTSLAAYTYVDDAGKLLVGDALLARLKPDFEAFLAHRARLVALTAAHLASGQQVTYESLMAEASHMVPITERLA